MPRAPKALAKAHHKPLYADIAAAKEGPGRLSTKQRAKNGSLRRSQQEGDDGGVEFVDAKSSRRILELAREQQQEIDAEAETGTAEPRAQSAEWRDDENEGEEEEDDDDYNDDDMAAFDGVGIDELEMSEADRRLFEKYMPSGDADEPRQSLAQVIMARIHQRDLADGDSMEDMELGQDDDAADALAPKLNLPPKVIQVYAKVGYLLSRYKSGKLPKAFKIIPSLAYWEDVVLITRPDKWTPHACYEATRVFVSNLSPGQAQRFMNLVVLERVRSDIAENKRLNYHLYMALKKGLYKPAAWFKGFLFPLSGCTLREAAIVASVLSKVSVPLLHSAAALMRLSEMDPPSGPTSLFMRVLLNKKYALPYKVIDALVYHFMRWKALDRPLAVLEHQSLLVFCQRYRNDMTDEQKDAIYEVVRVKGHHQIGPEIRRELANSVARGQEIPDNLDLDMS